MFVVVSMSIKILETAGRGDTIFIVFFLKVPELSLTKWAIAKLIDQVKRFLNEKYL